MVRTLITPINKDVHLTIPEEYVGKTIEITYMPIEELVTKPISNLTMADFWGVLSDETAQKMQESLIESRNEWERDI